MAHMRSEFEISEEEYSAATKAAWGNHKDLWGKFFTLRDGGFPESEASAAASEARKTDVVLAALSVYGRVMKFPETDRFFPL